MHGTPGPADAMLTKALGLVVCRLDVSTEVKRTCLARPRRLFTADRKEEPVQVMKEAITAKLNVLCSADRA